MMSETEQMLRKVNCSHQQSHVFLFKLKLPPALLWDISIGRRRVCHRSMLREYPDVKLAITNCIMFQI